ncbi:hypothetical protein LEP1GSC034_0457 [Leptospira interrogans str. 2003000735]|nr:hypothetical protein LEP1GSC034_0457 [Leptospira interrogans str. 2003000735]
MLVFSKSSVVKRVFKICKLTKKRFLGKHSDFSSIFYF